MDMLSKLTHCYLIPHLNVMQAKPSIFFLLTHIWPPYITRERILRINMPQICSTDWVNLPNHRLGKNKQLTPVWVNVNKHRRHQLEPTSIRKRFNAPRANTSCNFINQNITVNKIDPLRSERNTQVFERECSNRQLDSMGNFLFNSVRDTSKIYSQQDTSRVTP